LGRVVLSPDMCELSSPVVLFLADDNIF